MNYDKGLGPDGFDGHVLKMSPDLLAKAAEDICNALNRGQIPAHLKGGRVVALSKRKGSSIARLDEVRYITIMSHLTKIIEKTVLEKIDKVGCKLLATRLYQAGFKHGPGVQANLTHVLRARKRSAFLFVDLEKAFDRVDRKILLKALHQRCRTPQDKAIFRVIKDLLTDTLVEMGNHRIETRHGVP